jgi:hypothetical protein
MLCCIVAHSEATFAYMLQLEEANGALIYDNNNLHQQLVEVNDTNAQVAYLSLP